MEGWRDETMHVGVLAFEVGRVHLKGMSNVMSVA
jgi:hypothetical protein